MRGWLPLAFVLEMVLFPPLTLSPPGAPGTQGPARMSIISIYRFDKMPQVTQK